MSTPSTEPADPKARIRAMLAPIAEDMLAVERIIARELKSESPLMQTIAQHITAAGGKRMRPALLMLICRALGYEGELHRELGATVELLHTATLMHDDVVDESELRRGRETANARWGNGVAVLVGDFLYTRSFQMMIRSGNLRVMRALADAANTLSEGEITQMTNAGDPTLDVEKYFEVIERKTAVLFAAAAKMAAAVVDADEKTEAAVTAYAMALGNAFQIADDWLDYAGETEDIGKNLGADLREGKVTLPLIYARELANEADRNTIDEAVRNRDGDFAAISRIVRESGALERCRERAMAEVEKGKSALLQLPPCIFRDSLLEFLFYTVARKS